MDRGKATATLLLLLLLSGTLFFFRLGTPGLFDADEPAYAQAAREMLRGGDWITPHFDGQPRFDKPILFYWLITVSYRVFGVTEFAVRSWSALAAALLVLGIAWAGSRWFGRRAGLLAGVAFTANLLTALLARAAVTDMLLTLFVTTAILTGVEALGARPRVAKRWAMAGWAAMGLAVLVKGPVGLMIPAMALLGSLLALRELREGLRRLIPWEGPVLFFLITAPWFGLVWARNGQAFVQGFVIKHHLIRFTGVVSGHPGPIWFYLPVALVGFFPWSGLLPLALWKAGGLARGRKAADPGDRLAVVCLCWAAGVFLFFSLAGTKLPSYLFPAFPAMAILVGAYGFSNGRPTADNRFGGFSNEKLATDNRSTNPNGRLSVVRCPLSISAWLIGLTGWTLAVGLALTPLFLERFRAMAGGVLDGVTPPVGLVWWLAGLLAMGTTAGLMARGAWRPGILSAMMVLLILTAEAVVAPQAYAILQGSLHEFTRDAGRILEPGDPLVVYGLNAPSVVFYADRPVRPIGVSAEGEEELRRLTEGGRPVVVITRSIHAPRLDRVPGLIRLGLRGGYAAYSSVQRADRQRAGAPGSSS